MNYYLELFISKYVKSHKKDRLKYEANTEKKKLDFIDHFCHDTDKFVDDRKIVFYGNLHNCYDVIKTYKKESFFVISCKYVDGQMMNYDELLSYLGKEYMAIIAVSTKVVIIKEEYEYTPKVYILVTQN